MCTIEETRITIRVRYLTIFRAKKENFITLSTKLREHSYSTIYNAQVRVDNVDKSGVNYANIIH